MDLEDQQANQLQLAASSDGLQSLFDDSKSLITLPSSRQAERPRKECAGAPDTQLDDIMSDSRDVKNEHASQGIGRRSVSQRKLC